jgi:hypothetical protein
VIALFVALWHGGEQIVFGGEEGGSRAGGDADFVVDVLDVVVDGLHRNDELASDLLFGVTARDEPQDFHLALGEAGHEFPARPAYRVTRRCEHTIGGLPIEPARAGFAAQLFGGAFW